MAGKYYGFAIPISGVQYTEVFAESEQDAWQAIADGDYVTLDREIYVENYSDARLMGTYDEEDD